MVTKNLEQKLSIGDFLSKFTTLRSEGALGLNQISEGALGLNQISEGALAKSQISEGALPPRAPAHFDHCLQLYDYNRG